MGVSCRDIYLGRTALEQVGDECASNTAVGASDERNRTGNVHDMILFKRVRSTSPIK